MFGPDRRAASLARSGGRAESAERILGRSAGGTGRSTCVHHGHPHRKIVRTVREAPTGELLVPLLRSGNALIDPQAPKQASIGYSAGITGCNVLLTPHPEVLFGILGQSPLPSAEIQPSAFRPAWKAGLYALPRALRLPGRTRRSRLENRCKSFGQDWKMRYGTGVER